LLSSMPLMATCSGTMQAAATTGPACRKPAGQQGRAGAVGHV
jgi:hypothetical protein